MSSSLENKDIIFKFLYSTEDYPIGYYLSYGICDDLLANYISETSETTMYETCDCDDIKMELTKKNIIIFNNITEIQQTFFKIFNN